MRGKGKGGGGGGGSEQSLNYGLRQNKQTNNSNSKTQLVSRPSWLKPQRRSPGDKHTLRHAQGCLRLSSRPHPSLHHGTVVSCRISSASQNLMVVVMHDSRWADKAQTTRTSPDSVKLANGHLLHDEAGP